MLRRVFLSIDLAFFEPAIQFTDAEQEMPRLSASYEFAFPDLPAQGGFRNTQVGRCRRASECAHGYSFGFSLLVLLDYERSGGEISHAGASRLVAPW
jgi:hypothetical protein